MGFPEALVAADRAVLGLLGELVTYVPQVRDPVVVRGVFDAAYVRTDLTGGGAVESATPAVFLLLADLPADLDIDDDEPAITVRGVTYSVRERQRDGTGGVVLMLRETE